MQLAPLDSLAHLPGPPAKGNRCAAAIHAGQLLAYAASSAVVVVDVQRLSIATTLAGAHRQAAVTCMAWHPGGGPREPRAAAQLRLASGDDDGRVMVWNVNTGAVIAALEDPWGSAFGASGGRRPDRPDGGGGGGGGGGQPGAYRPPVVGLAWATAAPSVLAVLLHPCILMLWDYRTGGILWRKDFGGGEAFTGLVVDPLDRRRLVLCGARGSFIVLSLINPGADRTQQRQYQVDLGQGGALRCAFSGTRDMLFLLLQREIIVFDLEYGQPAASSPLPASRPPLDDLLGAYGHAACGKALCEGGLDVLYCSHSDGSLSLWRRRPRLLTYTCLGLTRLLPPALKFGAAPTLLALSAGLWRGLEAAAAAAPASDVGALLIATDGRRHPGLARRQSTGEVHGGGGGGAAADLGGGAAAAERQAAAEAAGRSVLLMGVASDGRVWQWQAPLLGGTQPEDKAAVAAAAPAAPQAELLGQLHTLPGRLTAFAACPAPVTLPGAAGAVVALAAGTATGSLHVATVQQGALLPLHATLGASLAAHPAAVQGLRWLGTTARLVSFSTEKVAQGFKNTLLLTDVRNRLSQAFREGVAADAAPLAGLRASPLGRYLLLLFRGAPSEIWSVGGSAPPARLRQVDLQFAAVEWLAPLPAGLAPEMGPLAASAAAAANAAALAAGPGSPGRDGGGGDDVAAPACNPWAASPRAGERAASGYPFQPDTEEPAEERLAFTLADGRTGVLGVRGRRISDARPRRPAWQALASGDFRAVALGAWGQSVLLGDGEGTLAHWDTVSGKCAVMETGYGRIHRIHVSPPPSEALYPRLPGAAAVQARVAVLFASGLFAAFDLDRAGELWATHTTASAAAARVGRVSDVAWLPLPAPIGGGAVLAATLADGALTLLDTVHSVDVRPRRARMQRYRAALHTPPPPRGGGSSRGGGGEAVWGLAAAAPAAPLPLLPRAWGLLLRLLLQRGVPEAALRELGTLAASVGQGVLGGRCADAEMALERLEADIWAHLPRACHAAWEGLLARRQEGSEPAEGPALLQLVESFAADSDEDDPAGGQHTKVQRSSQADPRDEAAAAALGLTSRAGSVTAPSPGGGAAGRKRDNVAHALRGLKGAVKSQLRSLAAGPGRGEQPLVAAVAGISDGYEYGQQRAGFTSLVEVLHAAATARGHPAVLSPAELAAYGRALCGRRVADRMALAAELAGEDDEARFWRRLPPTLAWLAAALRGGGSGGEGGGGCGAPPGRRLWEEGLQLAESGERSWWHEQMSRRVFEGSEELQEKRVLEYVALGDFQTAVGFLLASPPDRTTRYYRDALCTLGMAFACGLQHSGLLLTTTGSGGAAPGSQAGAQPAASAPAGGAEDSAARSLFVQAAKVITANAAAVGDTLLGVPLLCSTGQHADAAALLQDSGLWRYAATLTAHALRGPERAAALERWAGHVAAAEGRPWAAAGLLAAAGALRSTLTLLRQHGLPDAAAALVAACREADLPLVQPGPGGAELANLWQGAGQAPPARFDSAGARLPDPRPDDGGGGGLPASAGALQRSSTLSEAERSDAAREFQLYACEVLQQL